MADLSPPESQSCSNRSQRRRGGSVPKQFAENEYAVAAITPSMHRCQTVEALAGIYEAKGDRHAEDSTGRAIPTGTGSPARPTGSSTQSWARTGRGLRRGRRGSRAGCTKVYAFASVDYPGAAQSVFSTVMARPRSARSISIPASTGRWRSLLRAGLPDSHSPGSSLSLATGMNGAGLIVGYVDLAGVVRGFANNGGTFSNVDFSWREWNSGHRRQRCRTDGRRLLRRHR